MNERQAYNLFEHSNVVLCYNIILCVELVDLSIYFEWQYQVFILKSDYVNAKQTRRINRHGGGFIRPTLRDHSQFVFIILVISNPNPRSDSKPSSAI